MLPPLLIGLAALCLGSLLPRGRTTLPAPQLSLSQGDTAQVPGEIRAEFRSGQTFVTWREIESVDKSYRVYRSQSAILSSEDLDGADLLGEVDYRTSLNQGRTLVSAEDKHWIIAPGAEPLAADQGLFVHTVEPLVQSRAFYAVTSVQAGDENRILVADINTTSTPVFERAMPPQPVLQANGAAGEVWGHWVGDRETPFLPALAPWPSRGFNFHFQPGTDPGPHGLVLRLHAAGQTYLQAWPQRFEVPQDVDSLAVSDLMPYTGWSFWFGSQEGLPKRPSPETRVWNYTQQRIAWTIDWIVERLGSAHDAERLYVVGGSMGAIGGMYLLNEYPERFAAALLRNGLYDLEADDYRNSNGFESLFGGFSLGLLMRDGLRVLDRTNALFMARRDLSEDWPILRTINGRNDETVGWSSATALFKGLADVRRPAIHYFDERTHNPNGYWRALERTLLQRTFATRRDRPTLRFSDCSLDDDPGSGPRFEGTPIGTLNGYVEYDPASARSSPGTLDFDVFLRDEGALDDAPADRGWAAMTPWRTGAFRPPPGSPVLYTLTADGRVVDEHLLFADEWGRVRTPPAPLDTRPRRAHFQRVTGLPRGRLFLGRAPIAGDGVQVVLEGSPGAPWALEIRLGFESDLVPNPDLRPLHVTGGILDERGLADLTLTLPRHLSGATRLWGQAVVDQTLSPLRTVTIQRFEASNPAHVLPR